jgi:hypothetical protein
MSQKQILTESNQLINIVLPIFLLFADRAHKSTTIFVFMFTCDCGNTRTGGSLANKNRGGGRGGAMKVCLLNMEFIVPENDKKWMKECLLTVIMFRYCKLL